MKDLQLSERFSLREFERSATAAACGINNSVPSQFIPVLQQLCQQVLEPLRAFVGGPIIITSGYRCNELNVKVGGACVSRTVQHLMDITYTDEGQLQPIRMVPMEWLSIYQLTF